MFRSTCALPAITVGGERFCITTLYRIRVSLISMDNTALLSMGEFYFCLVDSNDVVNLLIAAFQRLRH